MNEVLSILYKGIASILVLFLFTKLMGRKQVSQLNMFDYIIGITIGSIASEMTMAKNIDFFEGTLGIGIYAISAFLISEWTMKSIIARRIIIGVPCILIQKGKILEESLKKSKIDINDLLQEARNVGYFDISQVEYAIMEANGKISFLPKSKYAPLTPSDMNIKTTYTGICTNLIIDGKIMKQNLKNIGKSEKWLMTRLTKQGYKTLDNLLLVTCDSDEKLAIFEKNLELEELKPFE